MHETRTWLYRFVLDRRRAQVDRFYLVIGVSVQAPSERDVTELGVNVEQTIVITVDKRILDVRVRSLVGVARTHCYNHVTGSSSVPQHDVRVVRARIVLTGSRRRRHRM